MAKCHPPRTYVGSLPFNNNHHHRKWSSLFSFRKFISSLASCGTSSFKPHFKKPEPEPELEPEPEPESRKLGDILNLSSLSMRREDDHNGGGALMVEERRKNEERLLEELRMVVKLLVHGGKEERENGGRLVRGFAKEDSFARSSLGVLGVIPPLVSMLDHHDHDHHGDGDEGVIQALYALLNLGIGNDLNKEAIVQAGAVHKMLKKIESSNGSLKPAVSEAIVANFLALSALDTNKTIIGASGAIPFLVNILEDSEKKISSQARQDSLKALYNLSISPTNVALILETNLIRHLISMLGGIEMSERILSILSNVVTTSEGRRAISRVPDVLSILIDVLNWTDLPGCQEKASYVLMVMAHKSYHDRHSMIELGIGSTLLELTLLGSTLAQKRASRILECLRVDKGKQVSWSFVNGKTTAAVSAPICGSSSSIVNVNKEEEYKMMSEEKKAVKQLVQQSLQNNMIKIVKRANMPQDFVPSEHLKSLTMSSTSKSLPF